MVSQIARKLFSEAFQVLIVTGLPVGPTYTNKIMEAQTSSHLSRCPSYSRSRSSILRLKMTTL